MANESDLRRGDFISPSSSEVLSRLRDVGVTLRTRDRRRLNSYAPAATGLSISR